MDATPTVQKTLDCRGLRCPLPVIQTRHTIEELEPGQVLEVLSTDPASRKDIPSWAAQTGHRILEIREADGVLRFYIEKSPESTPSPHSQPQEANAKTPETVPTESFRPGDPTLEAWLERRVQELVEQRLSETLQKALAERERTRKQRLAIIASKGTLDMAYPPLILATTAAAMEMEVAVFFTFYGLDIIHRKKHQHLKVPPLANPAMPVPVPNILGVLPGMTAVATRMMQQWMAGVRVPTIPELLDMARKSGVTLIACEMTMNVMGIRKEDLLDGIEVGGAATFLEYAAKANVNLFI